MHNIYRDKFYAHREPAWQGLGIVSQDAEPALGVLLREAGVL